MVLPSFARTMARQAAIRWVGPADVASAGISQPQAVKSAAIRHASRYRSTRTQSGAFQSVVRLEPMSPKVRIARLLQSSSEGQRCSHICSSECHLSRHNGTVNAMDNDLFAFSHCNSPIQRCPSSSQVFTSTVSLILQALIYSFARVERVIQRPNAGCPSNSLASQSSTSRSRTQRAMQWLPFFAHSPPPIDLPISAAARTIARRMHVS